MPTHFWMGTAVIVRTKNQLLKLRGVRKFTFFGNNLFAKQHACFRCWIWSGCSADYYALKQGRILGKVQSCNHRAHAVSKQKERKLGITLF